MKKEHLQDFVLEALHALEGTATIAGICKHVWDNRISIIPKSERNDLYYTWGYEIRWAGQKLRDKNEIHIVKRGVWGIGAKP